MRPLMAAYSSVDDHRKLITAYLKATNAITLVAAPVLLILAFLADPILRIIVGEKWAFVSPNSPMAVSRQPDRSSRNHDAGVGNGHGQHPLCRT